MDKKELRRHLLQKRKLLSPELREAFSQRACEWMLDCEELKKAKVIMAFHPFGEELDILPFVEEVRKRGGEIWLPLTISAERRLVPYRYDGPHMLKQGVYGIWEPDPAKAVVMDCSRLDAILVPGVAFDLRGGRMGYGAGYYDRFLDGLSHSHRPFLLGVGFSLQVVDEVPLEPHDILLDGIVTEEGCFHS
ncbi:5-formyltetrahydrofolate cyclo-ligase [Brevibacillus sp. AY1]|uniref:5-formyltetrahydrofolate cyclo-ligase n=1 Tax=Brevibacillus sp. AY1 TaxID=2807621 RepID=UPI002458ED62|nr:5-formyltetrahydrofolate cyclo-ligase [Brevibacillus sp. AY1]MDH4619686.1 5-formyltetrahydrofolate cyclo-ligase [Brevibacillus sp. AY1]